LELIENFIKDNKDIMLLWSSGKNEYEKMYYLMKKRGYDKLKNVRLYEYIYDMAEKVSIADIVICRSGAMTISEMATAEKCAVFIPSPNVTDNHQFKNASLLANKNAAILVPEERIHELTDTVKELASNPEKISGYEHRISKFAMKDSNKRIYEEILELTKRK
jgi:UDP-N-acetylglucosamine--N-acetylmuramyl-(pentapeptide) pyrophosphoryl-undecaprenol N-acetylglucosamine transferase